jgi:ABC-type glycerol-3-phosphate transport system permease component
MVCQACGASLEEVARFCPKCGAPMVAASSVYAAYPPPKPQPRVQQNLQILGILWCVFGVYRIIGGLVGMFFLRAFTMRSFGGGWPLGGSFGAAWMSSLLPIVAVYTVLVAALSLLVGYSLLTRRPWGRTLAIVVGVLTLLKPLLGTALGIYTLWVLSPFASGKEYEAMADHS